ncbi:MAG: hypothetical protein N3A63_07430 [Bacteroidetes bacterium]|nr:hypothetical protein [Bacteroidota bacterium]
MIVVVSLRIPVYLYTQSLNKPLDNVTTYYTNIGKIGLTVTNFGTIGTRNQMWPNQPSCEYPLGSRIEHIVQGGLWIGARPRQYGFPVVSCAFYRGSADDISEFTTERGATIIQRSSLSTSQYFSEAAISHQDFVAEFTDRYTRVPQTGDSLINHFPIGVRVRLESYAWNFPFAENYVILNYTIYNENPDTLEDVYVGLCCENTVRNTNYVRPGATGYFFSSGNGYDSLARMMYGFEINPSPGSVPADSYVGEALLGTTPFPDGVTSVSELSKKMYMNVWRYSSGANDLYYPSVDYDAANPYNSKYTRLTQSNPRQTLTTIRTSPNNYITMISVGPWTRVAPRDSINVVFAIICAKKAGTQHEMNDTREARENLYKALAWVQRAYTGEDINGNNQLDLGEDIVTRVPGGLLAVPDGKLTRYVLPTPPNQPKVRVQVSNQSVVLYWDKSAEYSLDPLSGRYDFAGYRIYRTKPGSDFRTSSTWLMDISLIGEFDRSDDTIGYNTGLKRILIDTSASFSGLTFPGDTTRYYYRFPPLGDAIPQLNGWQYVYGVSAYDQGDALNNLLSMESAMTLVNVLTGAQPTSDPNVEVGVYPNPYYVHAYWDGSGERTRKLYFTNLPARATITIYTLAGDVVAELEHTTRSIGTDIEWFRRYGSSIPMVTTGGEHAWDLLTKNDQAIATGLYLFTVKDHDTGIVKRGKFLVIK